MAFLCNYKTYFISIGLTSKVFSMNDVIQKPLKLDIIKSVYFKRIMFDHLDIVKKHSIVKYNKSLQKMLNIEKKHYNKLPYIEIVSNYDLEYVNKLESKFINIPDRFLDRIKFTTEFFNKETKMKEKYPKNKKYTVIQHIKTHHSFRFKELFKDIDIVKNIKIVRFYSIYGNDNMSSLCENCNNLEDIYISGVNFKKITNMKNTFANCYKLKILNISNFNLNKNANIENMFLNCNNLKQLNINGRNINLTDEDTKDIVKNNGGEIILKRYNFI